MMSKLCRNIGLLLRIGFKLKFAVTRGIACHCGFRQINYDAVIPGAAKTRIGGFGEDMVVGGCTNLNDGS